MARLLTGAVFALGALFMGWLATVPFAEQLVEPWMEPTLRGGFVVIAFDSLIIAAALAWPRRTRA